MLLPVVIMLAAQAPVAAPAAKVADPNERVCKMVYPIYSRIPERECRTRAQWDQLAKDSQEDMRRAGQNRASSSPSG